MNPSASPVASPGLLCVGVGRAGTHIVRALAAQELAGTRFVCLATADAPPPMPGVTDLPFGLELTRGFGCGGDVAHGRQAAEQDLALIRETLAGSRVVVLVTGLGGGTGGGAAPLVAQAARDAGALVLALATLPFSFDPPLRHQNARTSLQALRHAADIVLCLSNAAAAGMLEKNTRLAEVMANSNAIIADTLRGLWRMLTCPGLLPVGAAALERTLRGLHGESAFATVETSGEHRAIEAFETLLKHPFLQGEQAPAEADVVLVNLAAAGDLRLDELEWLQRQFQGQCERAQLLLGATDDPALQGRLALTVIAARTGIVPVAAPVVAPAGAPTAMPGSRLEASAPEAPMVLDGLDLDTGAPTRPGGGSAGPGTSSARRVAPAKAAARKKTEQQTFNFENLSKGRFEHTEPTYYQDQNLDEPTFMRRRVTLN